jgi:predicted Zn-dependent protease
MQDCRIAICSVGRPVIAILTVCLTAMAERGACRADDPPAANLAQEFFRRFQQQPFANPQEMFDRIFGTNAEAEQAALEKIEVSPEEERKFGEQAATAYLDSLKQQRVRLFTKGKNVDYLRDLAATIRPHMQHAERYEELKIIVARSDVTDARTFPGGTVVFFDGMLDFADNEAAVAGILGHELSHLDRGHQLTQLRGMKLAEQTFSGKRGGVNWMKSGPTLMRLWSRPFRPEDEKQADLDSAAWLYAAEYDPRELAKVFLQLEERNHQQFNPASFMPGFLRSHPYERDRYEAVMRRYDELQKAEPQEDLYIGRKNLEQRVARSKQEFPD